MLYEPFFKVIVLKIDIFESCIIDERHFSTSSEAHTYSTAMTDAGYVAIVAAM